MLLVVIFVPAVIPVTVAGAVFVIVPEVILIPVPAVNAPCALALVKYKFVLPSVKSSVVAPVAMTPAEALRTPESVPNLSPAKVGVLVVCIPCVVSNKYEPPEPVTFKFADVLIAPTFADAEESQYKIEFEKLPAGKDNGFIDDKIKLLNVGFDVVFRSWGKFKVILPVELLTVILFVVPVKDTTPLFDIVPPVEIMIPVPCANAPLALPSV